MRTTLILAAALTLVLAPIGVAAKPGGNNGNGNGKPHHNAADGRHGCPPGLAARETACVPPGLARQGVDTEDRTGPMTTRYYVGDVLNVGDFVMVTDLNRFDLQELPMGEQYAVIDGTLIRLDSDSYMILQLIHAAPEVPQ